MNKEVTLDDITIRTVLKPGDLGYVIFRHGKLYSEEYNYGVSFEAYVASGIAEFYATYDPNRDRVWICEHDKGMIGFLLLMHRENNTAQLRYFYVEPRYRGLGLGKKLMSLYIDFLTASGYSSSYLWTTHELDSAAALYKKHGFRFSAEKESNAFGKRLKEHRYDLAVSDSTRQ